jgi:methyltransferase-like protein/2-polyprenyl-3-methyl-5-hydroxy-6-metoxy-1,4-benzoquinol methylase
MSNTYDKLIYSSLPRAESHPGHLATIASFHGLKSTPIQKARVLELGCGTGGNLIPLAERYEHSVFVGIDLSSKQIEAANKVVADLNLKNIKFKTESITNFGPDSGEFDYIICHGVFSWVEKSIQDKILQICAKHLKQDGLAYISYNTLPGWKFKGALREMMQYHTQAIEDLDDKAQQAKVLINFLAEAQNDPADPYGKILKSSFQELEAVPNHYLFHEYLEKQNQAFYMHEFVGRLDSAGLVYVADAQLSLSSFVDLPAQTQALLEGIDDRLKLEQYLDFIRNRKLRESIICKAPKVIAFPVLKSILVDYNIAAEFISNSEEVTDEMERVSVFRSKNAGEIKSSNPLTVAALSLLQKRWPEQIVVTELIYEAADKIGLNLDSADGAAQRLNFEEEIYLFYSANLIELELNCYGAISDSGDCPRASSLARYQSLRQDRVTSLRHKAVILEPIVRQVLSLLDGSRDKQTIIRELEELRTQGKLQVDINSAELTRDDLQDFFRTIVERSLNLLSRNSFIERY